MLGAAVSEESSADRLAHLREIDRFVRTPCNYFPYGGPPSFGRLSRDQRRYYAYFLQRIINGSEPMTNITADFTADEANKLYKMLGKHSGVAQTKQSLAEYIRVIREESVRLKADEAGGMTGEQLNDYLAKIRKVKN